MDSDTVDTTERVSDRFKRPGPRKQPMVDLKYITFGFSYLQVNNQCGFTVSKNATTTEFAFDYESFLSLTISILRICWNML